MVRDGAARIQEGRGEAVRSLSHEHIASMNAISVKEIQLPGRGQAIVLRRAAIIELEAVATFEIVDSSGPMK